MVILSIHCIWIITKVLKEKAIDVRIAGVKTDKSTPIPQPQCELTYMNSHFVYLYKLMYTN
jgi:hypothetical protein